MAVRQINPFRLMFVKQESYITVCKKEKDDMKKSASIILLLCMIAAVFAGCGKQTAPQEQASQTTAIGNPWSDWDSIEEAESAIGFSFGLPEVIAETYHAVTIRTLNNKLIEVVYRDEDYEVCVRKQAGEEQDISGDYNNYETCTEMNYNGGRITEYHNSNNNATKQLISYNGYSWSLVAPNGYWGDSNGDFLNQIFEP